MLFFPSLIHSNFWQLAFSGLNHAKVNNLTNLISSRTSGPIFQPCTLRGSKRQVLQLRQLGDPQNATTTNTELQTPVPGSVGISNFSPSSAPLTVSEIPILPDFVTVASVNVPASIFILPSDPFSQNTLTTPSSTESAQTASSLFTPALVPTSAAVTSDSSLISPTSITPTQEAPLASPDSSNQTAGRNGSSASYSNRLVIPFIIISIICLLGLVIAFLAYLSPQLRKTRWRKRRSGFLSEDYAASARTFEPNPLGTLNYQRSLSRKKKRQPHLVSLPTTSEKPPVSKSKGLNADLWLPQTAAGPGLARPA